MKSSYVYAVNFNTSTLTVVEISQGPGKAKVVGTLKGFQRSGDPAKFTGLADFIAVRPGKPGVAFTGDAAYVLTINLVAADRTAGPDVSIALDGVRFDKN